MAFGMRETINRLEREHREAQAAPASMQAVTMTTDVTPAAGEILVTMTGEGTSVSVVRRDPPARPGFEWAAPYAVNCHDHGRLSAHATPGLASDTARGHLRAHREGTIRTEVTRRDDGRWTATDVIAVTDGTRVWAVA